jgi:hypothetical protein
LSAATRSVHISFAASWTTTTRSELSRRSAFRRSCIIAWRISSGPSAAVAPYLCVRMMSPSASAIARTTACRRCNEVPIALPLFSSVVRLGGTRRDEMRSSKRSRDVTLPLPRAMPRWTPAWRSDRRARLRSPARAQPPLASRSRRPRLVHRPRRETRPRGGGARGGWRRRQGEARS